MEIQLPTLNLNELEKIAIKQALAQTKGSVSKAAKLLGLSRATLYRRLSGALPATRRHEEEL